MKAELISVGTELLMGYILNSNARDIAKALLDVGIGTYYQQTVGDNAERIRQALDLASSRSDLIILTGGLGPTHDDITKQVLADFLGTELVIDTKQEAKLQHHLAHEGRPIEAIDLRQAQTLKGGEAIWNPYGLACGSRYQKDGIHYILLPGPPYEMNEMLKSEIIPFLVDLLPAQEAMASLYLNFFGIGESKLALLLAQPIAEQSNPTIGLYAKPRHIAVRLTANAVTEAQAQALNRQLADQLLTLAGDYYVGEGEHFDFEAFVLEGLARTSQGLVTVEGFTHGLMAQRLRPHDPSGATYRAGWVGAVTESSLLSQLEALQSAMGDQAVYALGNLQVDPHQVKLVVRNPEGQVHQRHVHLGQRPYPVQASIVAYESLSLLHQQLKDG